jgi:hypothetical protein
MDEPRDDVDVWLSERVKPLLPHPGSFERIRKRARRRKLGQAAIATGGAAVIVAAAVTVPHFIIPRVNPAGAATPATSGHTTPPQHTRSPSPSPSPSISSSSPSPSAVATAPPPVPPNFAASSVTFVSTTTGWVIGQAGTPGQCTGPSPYICTSVAATFNGGTSWQGVPAPVTGAPDGARGVSQIRSLNGRDGWAFGPQLYATHDGGQHWVRIDTHGMRVIDLETVNKQVFAVWARCTGTGPNFAANCTSFSLYTSRGSLDQWVPVSGAVNLTSGQPATASSAQLVLTGEFGYLLAPDGTIYQGIDWKYSTGPWLPVNNQGSGVQACAPGPAQADGLPSQGLLASTGRGLAELCLGPVSGGGQTKTLLYSPDGGVSWWTNGAAPSAGIATSLSGTPAGPVLVATTQGIDASRQAPQARSSTLSWRATHGAALTGGFSYVGMTTSAQGVAIPADESVHAVWFTYDGGKNWQPSYVR